VGCDPASKSNYSVLALKEFMIERTSDIHDFFTYQQRKVLSEVYDDEDLYGDMPVPQRAIEYSWGIATHAWKATCLPYPFYTRIIAQQQPTVPPNEVDGRLFSLFTPEP
jgi:hypothetical protein